MDERVLFATLALAAAGVWHFLDLARSRYETATGWAEQGGWLAGVGLTALLVASAFISLPLWLFAVAALAATVGAIKAAVYLYQMKRERTRVNAERQARITMLNRR